VTALLITSYAGTRALPGVICVRVSIVSAARTAHMKTTVAIAPARQK
jgi:hypothetical protein